MTNYEATTLWFQGIAIIITAAGIVAAFLQLRKMANAAVESQKANLIAATAAFVQVEVMVFDSLHKTNTTSAALIRLEGQKEKDNDVSAKEVEACQMELNGSIQAYLNSLDRLCACIRNGIVPERRAMIEYARVIDEAIHVHGNFVPDFEGAFPNIIGLRRDWNRPEQIPTPE